MSAATLQELFASNLDRLATSDPARTLRSNAMATFSELGYPTRKLENWRYTDLKAIAGAELDPLPKLATNENLEHAREVLSRFELGADTWRWVFVDGQLVANLSSSDHPEGLAVLGHDAAWQKIGELQTHDLLHNHPLAALNTAFTSTATFIQLAQGARIEQPLQLLFINSGRTRQAVQPRVLIDAGPGSQATVLQHFIGDTTDMGWTNPVTQVTQGRGSNLTLYRLQEYGAGHFHTELLRAQLARDATLKAGYFDLGGTLVRNDIHVDLAEPGAVCELFGVFLASQGQHVDNHTRVDHTAPSTTSREVFRSIIGERGRGVFNGKVVVHRDAQGASAEQSSDNLLLSERGEIDTKPELEIYTDDVKCSHGATVGELDPEQLFYLRSRGVDEAAARGLLTFAFANEVLNRIEVPQLRERVALMIAGQLPDYEAWGGLL